jgi:hypothetical protein
MAAKSGELARETGDYRCTECQSKMRVIEGLPITDCPNCGNESFDTGFARSPEPVKAAPDVFGEAGAQA